MANGDHANAVLDLVEEVWRRGRIDRLPAYFTDDCVNHAAADGDRRGLDALRRYHEGFAAAFDDFDGVTITVDDQLTDGDRVCTRITTEALHRPTGRRASLATIRIDRFEGDRIAEHWSVADMAGLAAQLGG